jgi:hypothetical protein
MSQEQQRWAIDVVSRRALLACLILYRGVLPSAMRA